MQYVKAFFGGAWSLLCEGYHLTVDAIERHPAITFWVLFTVITVAILK